MKTARILTAFAAAFLAVACGSQAAQPGGGTPGEGPNADAASSADGAGVGDGPNGSMGADATTGSDGNAGADSGTGFDGSTSVANRVRTILPFDAGWLFLVGDPAGANGTTFADTSWRALNVPHDWAIEGATPPSNPFSETAATSGRGAYAPSGVAWYRKHFTLDSSLSGKRVYVEFDGIMENSDVYVNGTHLGHHPYGYVTLRYDMTAAVQFGTTENVLAVRCDTSVQPAERFYAGAGIYRHVRVLATDPVHVDQFATFVQVPSPTAASATVKVQTSVINSGVTAQSVAVQGVVSGPTGAALPPVTTAAQSIPAGGSASFTLSVPVTSPALWDLDTPNMYQLVTNVQIGGTTVDDDVTSFGIRDLVFAGGLTLNGKTVKLQGVANHQDLHGLGMAAPQRALQRRLAQLKALGVNAFRTAHDPPSPDFLELTDRMGILVLDEFADVWTEHKYTDVGDYAAYFNEASTTPTGKPALPSAAQGTKWWEVDFRAGSSGIATTPAWPSTAWATKSTTRSGCERPSSPRWSPSVTSSTPRMTTPRLCWIPPPAAIIQEPREQPRRCLGRQLRRGHSGQRGAPGAHGIRRLDRERDTNEHLDDHRVHGSADRRVHVDRHGLSG